LNVTISNQWIESNKNISREEVVVELFRYYIQNGLSLSMLAGDAGDVVFIPHGWFCATIFVSSSVVFKQEFCTLFHHTVQYF